MNYNHGHVESHGCKKDIDCAKCESKHPKPQNILLECGEGTRSRTFTSSDDEPFQLAHVTLDTTCLNRPEILIKFSSLVRVERLDQFASATVRLKYELFRLSEGRQPLSIGTWEFEKGSFSISTSFDIEESFNFIFCECLICNDCCDYFVSVTPVVITNATATVKNGRMATLTQSSYNSLRNEPRKNETKHKYLKQDKIILACGKGIGAGQAIFENISAGSPINIAHVTIDTTCLNKPRVLIEFSSMIKFCNVNFINIILQFELFKVCGDGEPISCGIWTFKETNVGSVIPYQEQRPFSFIFCECLNISKCCRYFVKVTPLQAAAALMGSWEVYNTQINGYAQSSMDDCPQYDNYKILEDKGSSLLCNPVHPKPKKILLECGSGTGSRTFTSSSDETPFQLAHVTVDTTQFCKPIVNIEFSSTVSFESNEDGSFPFAQLQYELFRVCDGGAAMSIGVWTVDRLPFLTDKTTETFNFTYCDCITCPGCCDYFVTATFIKIPQSFGALTAITTVSNGRIVALAQEG